MPRKWWWPTIEVRPPRKLHRGSRKYTDYEGAQAQGPQVQRHIARADHHGQIVRQEAVGVKDWYGRLSNLSQVQYKTGAFRRSA